MSSMNKAQRLDKIKNLLSNSQGRTKSEISEELGISIPTVSRDIKALKDRRYEISCSDGRYAIIKDIGTNIDAKKFTKLDSRLVNLLWYIGQRGECSYESLLQDCTQEKQQDAKLKFKVCTKTLKSYLKRLEEAGLLIKREIRPGEFEYRVVEKQLENGIPVDLSVKVLKFIRANIAPLPFNDRLQTIADKLENGIIKSLSGNYFYLQKELESREILDQVGISYKTFSYGTDHDVTGSRQKLLSDLEALCSKNSIVEICLWNSDKPLRYVCLFVIYQVSQDQWYLVVKNHSNNTKYSFIGIEGINKITEITDVSVNEAMVKEILETERQAYETIVESFGLGLGNKIRIKLKIAADNEIIENIVLRLENYIIPEETEDYEDGSCLIAADIDGIPDFLHWLRGFGSKVVIQEPDYLRKLQYEETIRTLRMYMEEENEEQL